MATQTEILRIEVDNKQAQQNITDQTKKIEDLKEENKQLLAINKKLAKEEGDTSKERARNSQTIAKNAAVISKNTQQRKQNISVLQNEKNTLNNLRSQLALLTQQRNKDLQVGSKAFDEANRNIEKLNDTIKKAEQGGGDFRRSVGNYSKALDGAKTAFGGLATGIEGAAGATSIFNAALLSSPIGIIIVALTSMVAAFTQTEEGALKFKIVLEVIKSVFNDFVGLLAVGGKEIVNFFENPLEGLKNFGNTLQNFVIRRVELILDSLGTLGDAFKLLFEGEFEKAADKAGEGFVKLAANTNPLYIAYDELKEPLGDLVEETKEYTSQLADNAVATAKNVIAQKELEKQSIKLEKQIIKLQKEEERLQKITGDSTLPFQEQTKAQKELELIQSKRFKLQVSLAKQEKDILQTQLDIRKNQGLDTVELEKQVGKAEEKLFEIRGNQRLSETDNLQTARQRDQDIWEQELDFLIDVGEREREVFKRQAEDTSLSTEERTKALENYQNSLNMFQRGIRDQFNELGLSDEELDRLLGIKDPKELAEAITALDGLSEVEKNRLREGLIELKTTEFEREDVVRKTENSIKEIKAKSEEEQTKKIKQEEKKRANIRKQRLQDGLNLTKSAVQLASEILGRETKAGKALAITAAGINTAQAVTKTLATYGGTPIGYAQATAVGAAGLVQIAKMKSADTSGGSSSGNVSTPNITQTPTQVDTSNVDNQVNQQEALLAALESQRYEVSVTEINDVQNAVSVSESDSTI